MSASRQLALASALVLTAGLTPAGMAHGQSRDSDDVLVRAIQFGRGSRIGVTVQDPENTDRKDANAGVVVESVDRNGPAEKAGIKAGDTIVEFDGDRVRSVRQFQRLVEESASGRAVAAVVSRGTQRVTVNVTPEPWTLNDGFGTRLLESPMIVRPPIPPAPPAAPRAPRAATPPPPGFDWFNNDRGPFAVIPGRGRLGITTESVDGQLAEYFGVKDGALVKSVQDGSAAAKAGIKAGDVITNINGSHVYEPSDVSRAVNRLEEGGEFTVEVMRDHKTQTLKGKVDTNQRRRSGSRAES